MRYITSTSARGEVDMTRIYSSASVLERWVGLPRISLPILRVGFEGAWVRAEDIVCVELARYSSGFQLDQREEELALLLSDELSRVREILGSSESDPVEEAHSSASWLYAAGMELLTVWHEVPSPAEDLYGILEKLRLDEQYADLAYLTPIWPFKKIDGSSYLEGVLRGRLEYLRSVVLS
nr:hypothetical protein [Microbacterium testaceum]